MTKHLSDSDHKEASRTLLVAHANADALWGKLERIHNGEEVLTPELLLMLRNLISQCLENIKQSGAIIKAAEALSDAPTGADAPGSLWERAVSDLDLSGLPDFFDADGFDANCPFRDLLASLSEAEAITCLHLTLHQLDMTGSMLDKIMLFACMGIAAEQGLLPPTLPERVLFALGVEVGNDDES